MSQARSNVCRFTIATQKDATLLHRLEARCRVDFKLTFAEQ